MGIRELPGVTDEHRVSEVGRLFIGGLISRREYDAGIDYGEKILDYLKTIDAPAPYGDDLASIPDEVCLQRKLSMASAREILRRAGKRAAAVVERVTVYGEELGPGELMSFRSGLCALAGIEPPQEPSRPPAGPIARAYHNRWARARNRINAAGRRYKLSAAT